MRDNNLGDMKGIYEMCYRKVATITNDEQVVIEWSSLSEFTDQEVSGILSHLAEAYGASIPTCSECGSPDVQEYGEPNPDCNYRCRVCGYTWR